MDLKSRKEDKKVEDQGSKKSSKWVNLLVFFIGLGVCVNIHQALGAVYIVVVIVGYLINKLAAKKPKLEQRAMEEVQQPANEVVQLVGVNLVDDPQQPRQYVQLGEKSKTLAQQVHSKGLFSGWQRKKEAKMLDRLPLEIQALIVEKNNLYSEIDGLENQLNALKTKLGTIKSLEELENRKEELSREIAKLNGVMELTEYGVYEPLFDFDTSEEYKAKLLGIRDKQKDLIKDDKACYYPTNFTLDGSLQKGRKLVKDNVKQILRSFNNESDLLISKVRYNNFETIEDRITKSKTTLNKLNDKMQIGISNEYLLLKLEELHLQYELEQKKQEEKERAKEERERLREEQRVQKELEDKKKLINKEKVHYTKALDDINALISKDPENEDLKEKKEKLIQQVEEIDKNLKDIDYRESNTRAGYVYVISNIGSFGKNVYKIGMTRRLEPMDRVHELGDASVPFNFDVHAMIFSDDAPKLENALHKAFEDRKVNMVNSRREFFEVSLEEIEKVVKENFDKVVEFQHEPEASQYYESLRLKLGTKVPDGE